MKTFLPLFLILLLAVTQGMAQERKTHTVASGETLYSISRQLNVTVAEIKEWNDLGDNNLAVGQSLVYFIESGEETSSAPEETSGPSLISISVPQENAYYTVKSGDNLTVIARAHSMTVPELRELNNLSSDMLRIGQRLTVRKVKDSVAPSASEFNNESSPQGSFAVYTVSSGETVQQLLNRFKMTEHELQELNPGVSLSSLNNGQRITVLIPPTSSFDNPYYNKANLQDLGTVATKVYSESEAGNTTTTGELYDPTQLTAAHSNIALGSIIFIENEKSGQGIYVRINDRITEGGLKLSAQAYRILGLESSQNPLVTIFTES